MSRRISRFRPRAASVVAARIDEFLPLDREGPDRYFFRPRYVAVGFERNPEPAGRDPWRYGW